MSEEYLALRRKVDEFCAAAEQRASDALACRRGCDGCCHVWLSISPVEAESVREHIATLPEAVRARLATRGRDEREREQRGELPARCAMLEDDGSCAIYEARPLICRTQGLALRYPKDTIPESAVRWHSRGDEAELVACPLNFTERVPQAEETLDADMLNTLLALVNQRHAEATRGDPGRRTPLVELAERAAVLTSV